MNSFALFWHFSLTKQSPEKEKNSSLGKLKYNVFSLDNTEQLMQHQEKLFYLHSACSLHIIKKPQPNQTHNRWAINCSIFELWRDILKPKMPDFSSDQSNKCSLAHLMILVFKQDVWPGRQLFLDLWVMTLQTAQRVWEMSNTHILLMLLELARDKLENTNIPISVPVNREEKRKKVNPHR